MRSTDAQTEIVRIRMSIRSFILDRFPAVQASKLEDSTELLEKGIIDSLGVLDVVAFVESEFNAIVDDEDLIPENFGSIEQLATYLEGKLEDCS